MKKHIEAEKGELIIVSDEGHRAIIPAKDRRYFLDSLNGCDDCINKYIQQLPMMSNYAEDGSLVPDDGDPIKKETYEQWGDRIRKMSPNLDYTKDGDYNYRGAYEAGLEPVEVDNNGVKEYHLGSRNPKTGEILKYRSHPTFNQAISEDVKMGYVPYEKDGRIYTVDRKSKEYKDLYYSGKLMSYDEANELYIAPDLGGATIKATKPQWMKDKEALEKEYSKDWYIDNILPKFSRSMGISSDNMGGNQKGYDEYINNKVAESILKRNPKVGFSNNERLAWYNSLSEKERDIVNNSYSADKFSPAVRAYMKSQSNEAKKYGVLETFRDVNKLAQSVEGTPERFRIFPNAENNYENYVNPLMWIGDMAKGLGNVPKDIKEENYLKAAGSVASPLLGGALGGLGAKTTGQFIKNTFLPLGGLEENIVKGGKNLVVDGLAGKLSKADKVIDATKAGSRFLNKTDDVVKPIVSFVDDVGKQASKQWQLEELPGLHLKSTMSNNPKGLHTYVAKDGSIDTKSALDHLKRMEGDARYEVVLKNMQKKYGSNLENMPKRMDYNTLRKNIQDDLWNVGTGKGQPVDQYAGLDMKKFGIVKNDKTTSLGYESDEINLTGYSFTNKNNFIGGSNAHNMPQETLGHSRGFINPKEPGVYYSVERQSNWAQEANSNIIDPITAQHVKRKDIYERLLRNEKSLQEGIIEQDALIAAGNDTWAIMQKERMQDQLKSVQSIINDHHRYINASPQEKLVMKNMNERMLQEDVVYAATQGHTKYRMPSEEAMVKIQGWSKEKILTPENIAKREEIIQKQNKVFTKYQQAIAKRDKISEDIYSKEYDALNLEIKKINETAALGDYTDAQKTILKHTSQSLKDAEKLFGVKLKPITDSKGNTWYEFDIPKKFKKGKGEIKAFQVIPPAIGSALYLQSQNKNKSK